MISTIFSVLLFIQYRICSFNTSILDSHSFSLDGFIVITPCLFCAQQDGTLKPLWSLYPSGLNLMKTTGLCPRSCEICMIRLCSQVHSYVSCLFSSTSMIRTCDVQSNNTSGRRKEQPPSTVLSNFQDNPLKSAIMRSTTVFSFVL